MKRVNGSEFISIIYLMVSIILTSHQRTELRLTTICGGGDERSYASTNFVSNAIQCRDKRGLGAVVINGFILANHSPVRQQPPCWANLHATVSETNGVIIINKHDSASSLG